MAESGRVPGKGLIRSSTEKLSDEYRKIVESVSVPDNGRIRASTEKRLKPVRVPKNYLTSTEK